MADAPKTPEKKDEKPAAPKKKTWIEVLEAEVRANSLALVVLLIIIIVLLYWK